MKEKSMASLNKSNINFMSSHKTNYINFIKNSKHLFGDQLSGKFQIAFSRSKNRFSKSLTAKAGETLQNCHCLLSSNLHDCNN